MKKMNATLKNIELARKKMLRVQSKKARKRRKEALKRPILIFFFKRPTRAKLKVNILGKSDKNQIKQNLIFFGGGAL